METDGRLVRIARERAGLTQRALAERAGTSQPAVARIESGRGTLTLETARRLLAAAGFQLVTDLRPLPTPDPLTDAHLPAVDRSLLRENLRRSVEERLRSGAEAHEAGLELERAMRARRSNRSPRG
jgi:transcriptional regulator with XRE-family HTH domain